MVSPFEGVVFSFKHLITKDSTIKMESFLFNIIISGMTVY